MKIIEQPDQLNIETTWGCNLQCTYCPRNDYNVNPRFMNINDFKKVLDEIPPKFRVNIIGLGEPLINPDMLEMVREVKRRGLTLMFTTNGHLLTEELIDELAPNTEVYISISEFLVDKYKTLQGAEVQDVIAKVEMIKARRDDLVVAIQTLIIRDNYLDISAINSNVCKTGLQHTLLYPICFNIDEHSAFYPERKHPLRDQAGKVKVCKEASTSILVGIDGDIYPCCWIYEARFEDGVRDDTTFRAFVTDGRGTRVVINHQGAMRLGNVFSGVYDAEKHKYIIDNNAMPPRSKSLSKYAKVKEQCDDCVWRRGLVC